jgi:glycopeptide antibiotics resistance protein
MKRKHNTLLYMLIVFIVIFLGLLSRRITEYIPDIIDLFLGDSLWALMVYFIIRTLFKNSTAKKVALIALLFCFTIEISQLYHGDWIEVIRGTTLGGLILGYGFLWTDLVAYLLGIGFGITIDGIIEAYLMRKNCKE